MSRTIALTILALVLSVGAGLYFVAPSSAAVDCCCGASCACEDCICDTDCAACCDTDGGCCAQS